MPLTMQERRALRKAQEGPNAGLPEEPDLAPARAALNTLRSTKHRVPRPRQAPGRTGGVAGPKRKGIFGPGMEPSKQSGGRRGGSAACSGHFWVIIPQDPHAVLPCTALAMQVQNMFNSLDVARRVYAQGWISLWTMSSSQEGACHLREACCLPVLQPGTAARGGRIWAALSRRARRTSSRPGNGLVGSHAALDIA